MPDLKFLLDPSSSFWLWANLAIGVIGLFLTCFAWNQATSAKVAAEAARVATVRLTHEYQLNDLLTDMIEFQQLVSSGVSGSQVASRANRLRGRVREIRQRVVEDERRETILEKLDQTAQYLASIAREAVNQRTQDSTKLERITASLGDAISALSDTVGLQRNEQRGT